MKVLLINGSPNAQGCTFTALREVEKTLQENGIDTELISPLSPSVPIRGCIGCRACTKLGKCVFSDDPVNEVTEKLRQADALIVGSPVYYASANGALISLLDRVFYSGGKAAAAHKPAAAVASARRAGTTATLDIINKYFSLAQMPIVSSTYWNMVHGNAPEEVLQDEEGLQIMRNLGRNMAWMLNCIEAGKAAGISAPENEFTYRTNFIR